MAGKYVYCFNCLWHLMIPPTAPKNSFFVSSYGYFCMTKTCHELKFKFSALTAPALEWDSVGLTWWDAAEVFLSCCPASSSSAPTPPQSFRHRPHLNLFGTNSWHYSQLNLFGTKPTSIFLTPTHLNLSNSRHYSQLNLFGTTQNLRV